MSAQMMSRIFLVPLALSLFLGCSSPNRKGYYGTWTNEEGYFQKTVRTPDGLVQNYYSLSDSAPAEIAEVEIVSCWLDKDGNTWFRTQGTVSVGPNRNTAPRVQMLEKIDKTGTHLEVMVTGVAEFRPQSFPTKIDMSPQKKAEHLYRAFKRAETP